MERFILQVISTFVSHNREFLYKPRGFDNIWDMNKSIVRNWNEIVPSDAQVYILGDIMLCNNEEGICLLKQLKGKIHIIRGNHDSDTRVELYKACYNVVEVVDAKYLRYGGYNFYLSHYPTITYNHDIEKPLKNIMINVCGHSHVSDPYADWDKGYIFHVEVDAHNCTPIELDSIITSIQEQKRKDH